MIFIYDNTTLTEIFIKKTQEDYKLVVLFPITRIKKENLKNWERILEICKNSTVAALVILDKTPNKEATSYFQERVKLLRTDVHIVRRSPLEPIYDSQSIITIDNDMWILQLHDDDHWVGSLEIPERATANDMYSVVFEMAGSPKGDRLSWEQSPPARINFTALPSQVWNRFSSFIRGQGGHAAGSVDSTLNDMSRMILNFNEMSSFVYQYDNRHWEEKKIAKGNLRNLAVQDGWDRLSSEEIQLLNRRIDNLAALYYFNDLIHTDLNLAESEILRRFRLSLKKRMYLNCQAQLNTFILTMILLLNKFLTNVSLQKNVKNRQDKIILLKLIILSTQVRTPTDLVDIIRSFREVIRSPLLEKRFFLWETIFNMGFNFKRPLENQGG